MPVGKRRWSVVTGILQRIVVLFVVCAIALAASASVVAAIEWEPDSEVQDPEGELRGSGPNQPAFGESQPAPVSQAPAIPADPVAATIQPELNSGGSLLDRSIVRLALWLGLIGTVGVVYRRFA